MQRTVPFLDLPIVKGPIAGPDTPELTAAACEAGAFGILGCAYSTPERILSDVARMRALTRKPFGLNLFADPTLQPIAADALHLANERLNVYRDELGIPRLQMPARPPTHAAEQLDAVLEARPAAFSFTFGIPDASTLEAFRSAGIATIGTATTVDEALALEGAGVDIVCAQGAEAGGHRGTFLGDASKSLIGTLALVPQVVDASKCRSLRRAESATGAGLPRC